MYRLKTKLEKISILFVDSMDILLLNEDDYLIDKDLKNTGLQVDIASVYNVLNDRSLYYTNFENEFCVANLDTLKIDKFLDFSFYSGFNNIIKGIITGITFDDEERGLVLNLKSKKILYELPTFDKSFLLKNKVFYTYNNTFYSKDFNGLDLWHFPLSKIAPLPHDTDTPDTVSEIIGVASQKLWVTTEAGRLLVLDIETGELLKIFASSESDKNYGYEVIEGIGDVYLKDNQIIMINYTFLQKIDTSTMQRTEVYNFKEGDPNGIGNYKRVISPLLQGDYFTFLGEKEGDYGGIRHVGIFDYTAKKLVWQYQVINEEEIAKGNELIAPEPLYISGNKLYIKDFHQTLHIFEKEESVS